MKCESKVAYARNPDVRKKALNSVVVNQYKDSLCQKFVFVNCSNESLYWTKKFINTYK